MSPKAYQAARRQEEDADEAQNNKGGGGGVDDNHHHHHHFVMVDSKPYFPFLMAHGKDHDSIRQVVAKILQGSFSFSSEDHPVLREDAVKTWPVSVICGGITNQLFRVDLVSSSSSTRSDTTSNGREIVSIPTCILVRIFGAEGMIDRDVETSTYAALAMQGMAPAPYHGRFANGRLEGWLDNMIPLSPQDMADPLLSHKIAIQLARLHSQFSVPSHLQDYYDPQHPSLWTQLEDWTKQAIHTTTTTTNFRTDQDTQRAKTMIAPFLVNLINEIAWLRNDVVPHDAPVAFCHNDVLGANILHNPETGDLRLIDFEYGGVNYRAFDIANHFNEYAGGTLDGNTNYDWFPTQEHQISFLRAYLTESYGNNTWQEDDNETTTTTTPTVVQAWYDQVQAFLLVNHLYWGTWAVNQAAREGCDDFDFLLFAHNRLSRYFECKKAQAYPSS
jgi:ethanolamine kinase